MNESKHAILSAHSRQFENFRFAYPVVSRRSRGLSIGVNVNPDKVCNFDCPYCQVDRNVAPRDTRVDFDTMIAELDELLAVASSGEIWNYPRFSDTPESLRRINDIAFAGDGEPTTYPRLRDAIERVHDLRVKHHLPDVKIIVLTNATLLHTDANLAAFESLARGPYEIWAKLDAGTQGYFETIAGTSLSLDRIVKNITIAAKRFEITIQCLLPTVDGSDAGDDEIRAIADRVNEVTNAGGNIRLFQLYTTARKPSNPRIGMVPDFRLDQMATVLRSSIHVPVEVYYGRHWDEDGATLGTKNADTNDGRPT